MQGFQFVLPPVLISRLRGFYALAPPVQFLYLSADLRHIVLLKLPESFLRLLLQRLQFIQLAFLRPAFLRDRRKGLPDPGLHSAQIRFRYRTAAGGADDPRLKTLKERQLPAVLGAQFLDLCGRLRDVLGILGCVLLNAAPAELVVKLL